MKDSNVSISVIIPIYKVEDYLAKCLDSAFNQNFNSYEVICVNDGSPDNCAAILMDYQTRYSNLIIINRSNGGLSAARNTGIYAAKGEYLLFLDSDDCLESDILTSLYSLAKEHDLDVLIANTQWVYFNEIRREPTNFIDLIPAPVSGIDAYNLLMRLKAYLPMAYNNICRRQFIMDNELYFKEGVVFEDELWTPQVLLKAQKVMATATYHYNYFQRENTIINSPVNQFKIDSLFTVGDELVQLASNTSQLNDDSKGWLWTRSFYIYNLANKMMKGTEFKHKEPLSFNTKRLLAERLTFRYFELCLRELELSKNQKKLLKLGYFLLPVKGRSEYICRMLTSLKENLKRLTNQLYCNWIRKRNKNIDFTIISNNCWGGGIYEDLNIEYKSPTVGLFFYAPCFMEFLESLDKFLSLDLKFISESKYSISNTYRYSHNNFYPIGILDNVEIHFLHYNSEAEAKEKWDRRKMRINKENMYVKFCDRDLCTTELIERFEKLNFKNKVFFSSKKISTIKSAIYLPQFKKENCVGDLYNNRWSYRFRFNIIKWLNN